MLKSPDQPTSPQNPESGKENELAIYRRPLTIGEVLYPLIISSSRDEATSFGHILNAVRTPEIEGLLRKQLVLPPNTSGSELLRRMGGIEREAHTLVDEESKLLVNVSDYTSPDYLNWLYGVLSPDNVLKAKSGDCKQFSVLGVLVARDQGTPARIVPVGDDHAAYEQYFGDEWHHFDFGKAVPFTSKDQISEPLPPEYDRYYRETIELLTTPK